MPSKKAMKIPCVSLAVVIILSIVIGIVVNRLLSGSPDMARMVKSALRWGLLIWLGYSVYKNSTDDGCDKVISITNLRDSDAEPNLLI